MTGPRLALGTVQFGLGYGIAGRTTAVPEREVRAILSRAWEMGIRRLDTAPSYGGIEERLAALLEGRDFSIVSKVPAVPADGDRAAFVQASIAASRKRLGDRLSGILFHAADDLLNGRSADLWRVAESSGVALGASCYDAAALATIAGRYPITMAQLPGNALDQAVGEASLAGSVEITIRSVFLQGLLLLPTAEVDRRVPAAANAVSAFHDFAAGHGLTPLAAALGIARGLANVDYCVIGVDSHAQLDAIADAWVKAPALQARQLDVRLPDVIDPRRWSMAVNV